MSSSPIARKILSAVAALAAASCSSTQASSSSNGAGTATSDDPPWEEKIKTASDEGSMLSRQCYAKATVWDGRAASDGAPAPSASATPAPHATCPTPKDLVTLGQFTPSQPTDPAGSALNEGPVEWNAQCCYLVSHWHMGRPFVQSGVATTAPLSAAVDACGEGVDGSRRRALAVSWLRDAELEHASIASFARFALDLLALGAPSALVEGAHRAALDEIDHTRRCASIAARYGLRDAVIGALPVDADRPPITLGRAVRDALAEGCVAETAAALLAEARLREARRASVRDADVEDTLATIAADEARHASLAFAFVAWALERDPSDVRAAIDACLASLDGARAALGAGPSDPRIADDTRAAVAADAAWVVREALRSIAGAGPRSPERSIAGAGPRSPERSLDGAGPRSPERSIDGAGPQSPERSLLGATADAC